MQTWSQLLAEEKQSDYFKSILKHVAARRQHVEVFPPQALVFEAFRLTAFDNIRVVILGQDPYHGIGQAHGLCFSVNKGIKIPPSLRNIFQELESDLGISPPKHGFLNHWAKQGVLLLNAVLTVESGNANSHQNIGWESFTNKVISLVSEHSEHVVYLLWGASAQKKVSLIDASKHTILSTVHPSPLSAYRGFLGCKHFSKANKALIEHQQLPIDWKIAD